MEDEALFMCDEISPDPMCVAMKHGGVHEQGGLPNAPSHKADLAERVQPVCCGGSLSDAHTLGRPGVYAPHKARQDPGVTVIKAPGHRPELACWQAASATV